MRKCPSGATVKAYMSFRFSQLYPVAFAIYLPLALAADNSAELITLNPLVWPVVWSLVIGLVACALGHLVTRDGHKAAAIALVVVISVSCFGYFISALQSGPLSALDTFPTNFSLWLLIGTVTVLAVLRCQRSLRRFTAFLGLMSAFLLVFAAASVAIRAPALHSSARKRPAGTTMSVPSAGATDRPDIYLIILDKYTGARSLRASFNYDNRPFESGLRKRGFFVPTSSHANYVHTFLVLASLLNWDYLDSLPRDASSDNRYLYLGYDRIEHNKTVAFLKARGYKFVFFPTGLPATSRNREANLQLPDPSTTTSEFEVVWLRTTLLPEIARQRCRLMACREDPFPYSPESASRIDWKFRRLAALADEEGPQFVLAHLLVPHEPYLYNADCSHRRPYWPAADSGAEELSVKRAYIEQLKCVNTRVNQLVDELLRRSTRPPVILLQSDHGHGRLGRDQPELAVADPERVQERLDIFGAYYLPAGGMTIAYDSISPINVMRGVLRHYFGAPLHPVADASYWSAWERPYAFTRLR